MKDITKCEIGTIFGGIHCFDSCNTGKKAKRLRCKQEKDECITSLCLNTIVVATIAAVTVLKNLE